LNIGLKTYLRKEGKIMKDVLLKIKEKLATEIADMVKAFIEWIVWDENFLPFKKGGEIFWRDKDDN